MKAPRIDYIAKWVTFVLGNVAYGWCFITILMLAFISDYDMNAPAFWLCLGWGAANMVANAYIDKYIRMVEKIG